MFSLYVELSAFQRSSYIIILCGILNKVLFSTLCFIDTVWVKWDFVRSGFSIVKQFHILSFFPIANMYFVL